MNTTPYLTETRLTVSEMNQEDGIIDATPQLRIHFVKTYSHRKIYIYIFYLFSSFGINYNPPKYGQAYHVSVAP
jgi:hypothetical protein